MSESDEYKELSGKLKEMNKEYKLIKHSLQSLILSNSSTRSLRSDAVVDKNIISVFDSVLTRTLRNKINELTMDIVVVQTYF